MLISTSPGPSAGSDATVSRFAAATGCGAGATEAAPAVFAARQ